MSLSNAPWGREAWRELWPLFAVLCVCVFIVAASVGYLVHRLFSVLQQGCVCV